jgi:hypothetical protein
MDISTEAITNSIQRAIKAMKVQLAERLPLMAELRGTFVAI